MAGAGPAAVFAVALNHAVEGYGPVLSVLNDAVDEAAEAVFSAGRSRAAVPSTTSPASVLEFRRAAARWPRCSTAWRPSCQRSAALQTELTPAAPPPGAPGRWGRCPGRPARQRAPGVPGRRVGAPGDDMRRISSLGRDLGGPDPASRHLRNELPVHARARLALRLPADAGGDGGHLPGAVPRIPALRLAVAGATPAAQALPTTKHEHVRLDALPTCGAA